MHGKTSDVHYADEIDAYLAGGGAYSQGRLRTYPFICCMKMKDRGQVLSRNSMGSVEAVMHCLVRMIHTQIMMEKDCFLQEVLMEIIYVSFIILE